MQKTIVMTYSKVLKGKITNWGCNGAPLVSEISKKKYSKQNNLEAGQTSYREKEAECIRIRQWMD